MKVSRQRGVFFALFITTLAINIFLSMAVLYKKETVILVPGLEHEYKFTDGELSKAYIGDTINIVTSNLFDLTARNIDFKQKSIEKFTDPSFYNQLQDYFQHHRKQIKDYKLSTAFSTQEVSIDTKARTIVVDGIHYAFFGKDMEQKAKRFIFKYRVKGKRLYITSFTEGALDEKENK